MAMTAAPTNRLHPHALREIQGASDGRHAHEMPNLTPEGMLAYELEYEKEAIRNALQRRQDALLYAGSMPMSSDEERRFRVNARNPEALEVLASEDKRRIEILLSSGMERRKWEFPEELKGTAVSSPSR